VAEHDLKVWSGFYDSLLTGEKTFEVRRNDRNFQVGDVLRLREFIADQLPNVRQVERGEPAGEAGAYTGRAVRARVTYVLREPILGVAAGWCVLSVVTLGALP
jgi:hypothetical protein